MKTAFVWMHKFHLDVALGAGAVSIYYFVALKASIAMPLVALLVLCTWLIYIADRELDWRKATHQSSLSHRHVSFIISNKWGVGVMLLCIAMLAVWAYYLLPIHYFVIGACVAVLCVVYVYVIYQYQRYLLPKECWVSIIYPFACALPAMFSKTDFPFFDFIIYFVPMCLLVWLNVLTNSIADWEYDSLHGYTSIATRYGLNFCKKLIKWFFTANIACIILVAVYNIPIFALLLAMWLLTLRLYVQINLKEDNQNKLYKRIAGEWVFHMPWFALLFT